VRIRAQYTHGLAALAAVETGNDHGGKYLASAARDARALSRERIPWGESLARLLDAGVALQAGRRDACLSRLERVADEFAAQRLAAHAAAVRDRLAHLRCDDMSAVDISRAHAALESEGVAAPERLIKMLVPSFVLGATGGHRRP
jgi:hypothetical protein